MGVAYAQAGAITAVPPMFGTVDVDSVLLLPRIFGDANWDGLVNLADFNRLAANFGQANKVWTDGDFNYDGTINLADFNRLAANFGMSASGAVVTPQDWANLAAAIPEPGALASVAAAGVLGLATRRRKCM
jgi:hypothetical protein